MRIKEIVSKILIAIFIFSHSNICIAENLPYNELTGASKTDAGASSGSLKGGVEYSEQKENPNIFTGKVDEVQKGAKLKMTVSSVIGSTINQAGDEFFAEVTDDFSSGNGIVLPAGTVSHGTVSKVGNSKRLGRDGFITIKFDYLVTPDGRKIPIEASMTTKRHPAAETAKVVLEDTAYTAAGGIIGGLLALKFFGLGAAVASKGSTLAGGAGIGALFGLTASLIRKGNEALISPGDEIKVNIVQSLELPVLTNEALKDKELLFEGLDVKITGYVLEKDPFGELNTITLSLDINNKTQKTFSSFDMALVSEYKTVYYASPFGNTDLWFKKITPNSKVRGCLSFSVDSPKKKHWLVFYDSRTRKPIAKFSLKNAERELKKVSSK